jgi:hypothetical protein
MEIRFAPNGFLWRTNGGRWNCQSFDVGSEVARGPGERVNMDCASERLVQSTDIGAPNSPRWPPGSAAFTQPKFLDNIT